MDTCRTVTREAAAIRVATEVVAVAAKATTRATVVAVVATITQLALTRRSDREVFQVAVKDSTKTWVDRAVDAAAEEWANRAEAATWVECTEVAARETNSKVLVEAVEAAAEATKVTKTTVIRTKAAQVASKTTKQSCASTSTRERLVLTLTTAHTPMVCTSYASPTLKHRAAKWAKVCIKTRPSTSNST